MEAVATLYGEGEEELSREMIESLSRRIFEGPECKPLGGVRRALTGFVFRLMDRTTRREVRKGADGVDVVHHANRILERSGHPYTQTLLHPSRADTASLVEGGDPMNAIYMFLCPEVARAARIWDYLLLDSVPSRDVQVRFAWETRLTHDLASQRLKRGEAVRIKAFAAGTGLSVIVACDRLLRDGHDPRLIRAVIADRDPGHSAKTIRLLKKLPRLRDLVDGSGAAGIHAQAEDLFAVGAGAGRQAPYHVVTAIGILEYFPGTTYATTEARLGEPMPSGTPTACDLFRAIAACTAEGGSLIVNTHRESAATRILEVFGKRFRYRKPEHVCELASAAGFSQAGIRHSGNVYDVEVFRKTGPTAP
jgi:hypothetical protein